MLIIVTLYSLSKFVFKNVLLKILCIAFSKICQLDSKSFRIDVNSKHKTRKRKMM